MLRKLPFILMMLTVLMVAALSATLPITAQTATPARTPLPTIPPRPTGVPLTPTLGPGSNVTIFFVACDTRAVINLSGTMLSGEDVYYQVFSGGNGTGSAITALRRVQVSGTYAFSEVVNYNTGVTVAAGTTASVEVAIARESDATRISYETIVNDIQDGCADPQNQTGASTDLGNPSAQPTQTSPILSPFGGYLNPGYAPRPEEVVVIGPRNPLPPRQQTPGLVFAECRDYDIANPGLIYDTDDVTVFWSWFARTPEQVQAHIDNAIYEVGYFDSNPFQEVRRSDIVQRDGLYWVFYTVNLGNVVPGFYPIEYKLRWQSPITDGFEDYGPGTANQQLLSGCVFGVWPNPTGEKVSYEFP